MASRRLLLVAPGASLGDLDVLLQAWRERGIEVVLQTYHGELPAADRLRDALAGIDALLLAGDARRAPATVLPGPFLINRSGSRIPAAWLPLRNAAANRHFAATAARVQRRACQPHQRMAVALLGQWHPRYLRVTNRIAALLESCARTVRWTGDVIGRDDMLRALGTGLGLGVYVGHGRASGWVGYQGVRGHHFEPAHSGEPLGALLSLCCRTASRRRVGLSYAEALPLRGVAAASLGATSDTLHTDNTRWAIGLCDALVAGAKTVGELIVRGAPPSASACAPYRLMGDPLAPLASARTAVSNALAVTTYP
ncbi:MAG TPA: C25 family cysteine peptidase [Burkholderiales bacterium]|nr:C25 family cysteine peptidase [Burkholderiales bacterium]